MQARREIIWEESKGYNKLYKKEKMDEARLCSSRYRLQSDLFLRLLSIQDKSTYVKDGSSGRSYRLVADARKAKKRPRRKKKYDEEVLEILKKIWVLCGFPMRQEIGSMHEFISC